MKRLVTFFALAAAIGCTTIQSNDRLHVAALQAIGAERVAWLSKDQAAIPSGVNAIDLKSTRAAVDGVDATHGTATITTWYTGTFSTPDGPRDGTLRITRRLHFTRGDNGMWTVSAPAEEIARNSSWSSERQAS